MKITLTFVLVASMLAVPSLVRSSESQNACCEALPAAYTAPATQPTKWIAYGEKMKLTDADNLDAARVLSDVKKFEGKTVRLTGNVTSVCSAKGCWLKMSSPGSALEVFVKFTCPIEGRLIPVEAAGKPVIVEGKLTVKTISEEDARHIAGEAGKSQEEIDAIYGEQKQIEMAGPSALVAME